MEILAAKCRLRGSLEAIQCSVTVVLITSIWNSLRRVGIIREIQSLPLLSSCLKGDAKTTVSVTKQTANGTIMLCYFLELLDERSIMAKPMISNTVRRGAGYTIDVSEVSHVICGH